MNKNEKYITSLSFSAAQHYYGKTHFAGKPVEVNFKRNEFRMLGINNDGKFGENDWKKLNLNNPLNKEYKNGKLPQRKGLKNLLKLQYDKFMNH